MPLHEMIHIPLILAHELPDFLKFDFVTTDPDNSFRVFREESRPLTGRGKREAVERA